MIRARRTAGPNTSSHKGARHGCMLHLVICPAGKLCGGLLQGNCTGPPPALDDLSLDTSPPLLQLSPGQCIVALLGNANLMVSGDIWLDGVYIRQAPGIGGAVHVGSRLWSTHSTFDWSSPGDHCDACVEGSEAGLHVEGALYAEGVAHLLLHVAPQGATSTPFVTRREHDVER